MDYVLLEKRIEQLETLCKNLAKRLDAVTGILHRRAVSPEEVQILTEAESALTEYDKLCGKKNNNV